MFQLHLMSYLGSDAEDNGSSSVEARMNYFGRLNYDFNNKYLAEFVWRYDGSYIFPESKRFGSSQVCHLDG